MKHDPVARPAPGVPFNSALYAELYRREEGPIREVASAVRAGQLSRTEGRERVLTIFAALKVRYLERVGSATHREPEDAER